MTFVIPFVLGSSVAFGVLGSPLELFSCACMLRRTKERPPQSFLRAEEKPSPRAGHGPIGPARAAGEAESKKEP